MSNDTSSFSLVSLLDIYMQLLFKSLSPNSILIGIPFTSDEANLNPGDLSLSSIYTVMSFDNNLFYLPFCSLKYLHLLVSGHSLHF